MRLMIAVMLLASGLGACAQQGTTVQTGPAASIPFSCPAPGTQVSTTTTTGSVTNFTWSGTDSSDPTTCLTTTGTGQKGRLLYGYYALPFEGETEARSAFQNAFAGSTSDNCFNVTTKSLNASSFDTTNTYRRCIRQLGPTIVGNASDTKTIAFELSDRGMAGNNFSGIYTLYYDPASKMFLKVDFTLVNGNGGAGWTRNIVSRSGQTNT